MDDIYNDLDNFNDVNVVEELKNENKELKFKLEEYSSAMHQLQKDFDKLSVEYKNLEKNYSSLLKTARAEIERKTDTIKNLNLEKDKLVLNSLQKGKTILHNKTNFKDAYMNKKSIDSNSCIKDVKKTIKESAEPLNNQLHVNRQPSVDTVSSVPTDCQSARNENKILKTEFENKIPKEECIRGRDERNTSHMKDNVQERPSVRKVMDRRKSILSFGECEPTFSSDEDSRKTNIEAQQRNLRLPGEDVRHLERPYKQHDYAVPESFDYYQPPSSYRNRGNKYNDFERQRNYECYDKSRKYYSPGNHNRYGKELTENYNQRDYRDHKRRAERSPPSDRYNRSKSRDRRYNYERDNVRDYGRHSYHTNEHEHVPAKNKSKFDIEEPTSKRPKVDTYTRNTTEDKGLSERHTLTKPQETLAPSSCETPDYINIDTNVHRPVKELKHTALTPVPDPRLLSKYTLKSNSEKPNAGTVAGCNIKNTTAVSNPTWGKGKQKSLGKSNQQDNLESEIYKEIDTFGKSPSLESGEIQSLDEDHYDTNYSNISDQAEDNVKTTVHRSQQNISPPPTKEVEKSFMNKYKIPHLKRQNVTKDNITKEQQDVSKKKFVKDFKVIVEGKHLSEKYPEKYINDIAYVNSIDKEKSESILQKLMNEKKLNDNANATKYRKSDKIVNISTIEGDLELSDETSDNMDLIKEDKSLNIRKDEKNDHLTKREDHLDLDKEKSRKNKSDDKVNKSKDSRKSSHTRKEHVKEKTRDSSKKRKHKKQTDQEELNEEKLSSQAKRKEKLNSFNHRKTKFSDLFGDSNSLITPDDLGIPAAIPDKYVAVYEDTQDAVDLSVEDITIVKGRKSVENTNVGEEPIQKISDGTSVVNSENLNSNENIYKDNTITPVIYENTISDTDTSNIVKTVIISTGIQPQRVTIDIDDALPSTIEESDLKKNALNPIKAIATSTPFKHFNSKESQILDSEAITNEFINTKEIVDKIDLSPTTDVNLETQTSENKCETDIPDVRIFVRRRKKATKKST